MGSGTDRVLRFGRYTLHPIQGLTCDATEVRVTQKALSVLWLLARRSGQLVTKREIFEEVWPDVAVTDAALTSCIQELRRALGDEARAPTFIETRHRRGFRFLAPTDAHDRQPAVGSIARARTSRRDECVGRHDALLALSSSLADADEGARQLVVVHGEPGIGKTTLVEAFLAGLPEEAPIFQTKAACVEQYGAGEPYRPVLDAVTRLCRKPRADRAVALLRQCAPTWLAQLPALLAPEERALLERRAAGVTRERMARELTDWFESLGAEGTVVLWIDDLQWADDSTLDWLTAFTARPDGCRILIIAALRAGHLTRAHRLCAALQLTPWCRQTTLGGLDRAGTRALVERRREGDHTRTALLADRLFSVTEGHPLFLVALLNDADACALTGDDTAMADRWRERQGEGLSVPQRLRSLIDEQIGRLDGDEPELLEVASLLSDADWSSALVAAGSATSPLDVERTLTRLAARESFIRHAGTVSWPDGTVAECFSFRHAIHREVLRARRPAGLRAEAHRRIADRMEHAFGANAQQVALQLALHFEEAGDVAKAARYLAMAASTANRIGAAEEGSRHVIRALALTKQLPSTTDRDEQEIELQMMLGGTLMAARGWGAPEVERAYRSAGELCERLDSTPQRFSTYWGLWLYRWGRGELAEAHHLAETLQRVGDRSADPWLHLQVHHAHWATAFCLGRFDESLEHAARGSALCHEPVASQSWLQYGNHHAGVCARSFAGRSLAAVGRAGDARRAAEESVADARRFGHPFSLALSLVFAAATYQLLRVPDAVRDRAAEAEELSVSHGFALMAAWARALKGWAAKDGGNPSSAVDLVRDGAASALATGSGQFRTYFLALLAETQLKAGQAPAAASTLDEAFGWVQRVGERFHEAELHRLRGELLLNRDKQGASRAEAEVAFENALAIARAQGAHLFSLRAATALARDDSSARARAACREQLEEAIRLAPDPPAPDGDAARKVLAMPPSHRPAS